MSEVTNNQFVVEGRIVYAHLAAPDKFGKYSCQIIVDKKSKVIGQMTTAIKELIKANLGGKKPAANKIPVGDAEERYGEEFADSVVIKCSSTEPVRLLSASKQPLDSDRSFPNGCDVKALLSLSAYSNEWGPGMTCFINGCQFIGENDPIGRAKPSDATIDSFFDPIEGSSEGGEAEVDTADFFKT